MICLPASINNNLPGSEQSIGSDTALNNIVGAVDKIKQSAVASKRCFVVEVMGRRCGYLALLSGLATGAERVYMHEEGVTLADLQRDLAAMAEGFRQGKRLGLVVRAEEANPLYTTPFMYALFEQEGGELFDVRQAILGHLQQGGDPSPFDRILATRFAAECVEYLVREAGVLHRGRRLHRGAGGPGHGHPDRRAAPADGPEERAAPGPVVARPGPHRAPPGPARAERSLGTPPGPPALAHLLTRD